jgi:ribosomal protein L21
MGKILVKVKDLFQPNAKFEVAKMNFESGQVYVLEKILTYKGDGVTLDGKPLSGDEVEEVILSFSKQKMEAKEKRAKIRQKVNLIDYDCCNLQ